MPILKETLTLEVKNSSVWLTNRPFDPKRVVKEITPKMMKDLAALNKHFKES